MGERISGDKDERRNGSKKMTNPKKSVKYEKTKPTNNRNRAKRRKPGHGHRKYILTKP